jgi:uncharacterized protein
MSELMRIEVAYALPEQQYLITVMLESSANVADAIDAARAALPESLPELAGNVGIFSKMVSLETKLKSGDRVEIYRALSIDPMDQRRARAKTQPIKRPKGVV